MTEKIKELTQEQKDLMPLYVEKWTEVGLSTKPVDKENAIVAVKKAYRAANLDEPVNFHVVGGPTEAIELIQKLDPDKTPYDIYNEMSYGNHDASWLAFYDYMKNVVGVPGLDDIEGLTELAHHCGWLNMYEDTVVFHDRPEEIHFDEDQNLHNEFGPSIKYRDGTEIYTWHGITIPDEWIKERDKLKAETALTWENVEQRRCACEIIGWVKILSSLDYTVIDSDVDPQIGDLLEVSLPNMNEDGSPSREKFLQVVCGTGRTFALPVPPEMKTALEANAWTYDVPADVITDLEVRT